MNRILPLTLTLGSIVLLSGCAGTASEFECNATTSDTCMTIEQANDKAKRLEEGSAVKPDAAALPRLADGNFRTVSARPLITPAVPVTTTAAHRTSPPSFVQGGPSPAPGPVTSRASPQPLLATVSSREMIVDPRPLRVGEKTAALWIAPYIDTRDVYHQPGSVFFVVKPSEWGKPRVN